MRKYPLGWFERNFREWRWVETKKLGEEQEEGLSRRGREGRTRHRGQGRDGRGSKVSYFEKGHILRTHCFLGCVDYRET